MLPPHTRKFKKTKAQACSGGSFSTLNDNLDNPRMVRLFFYEKQAACVQFLTFIIDAQHNGNLNRTVILFLEEVMQIRYYFMEYFIVTVTILRKQKR